MKRYHDKLADDPAVAFDDFYGQALQLVHSKEAQEAFDISKESDKVRDNYGRNDFAQRLLLARRLVEVGVSFVTVYSGGWGHHPKIFDAFNGNPAQALDNGRAGRL